MGERKQGRTATQLRPLRFVPEYQVHPAASVLACFGRTRVICAVSVTAGVPRWMREQSKPGGWLTAEYQMLPGATPSRSERATARTRPDGRGQEIQRLVGRCLRAVVDLAKLPPKTFYIDCDVLDADGGTRCAAITGGCVALELALHRLAEAGELTEWPLRERVAAVSVGIVNGEPLLDLDYDEDVAAAVDMNVAMTSSGKFVEVQGTAEGEPFSNGQLRDLLALAGRGLRRILRRQEAAVQRGRGGPGA
jgi:ribonuclease PH